ncbi:hypothetical protein AC1031_006980 [Aphanomyces cochlioides]|nr:hypothetical protein AC1031_006980 [Aphanomyces cochlioides]
MDILRKLDHPNIVKLVDVFDNEAGDMCYLVMELVTGGELFDRIIAKDHYTEGEAKVVVRTVASVLVYCHAQNIAHRDLKPENLLYANPAEDAPIKIADFGFAIIASDNVVMQTMCGTPGYFAPEVIAHRPYEQKCDIWSLGVITYILLCGFPPFYDESQVQEMEKVIHRVFLLISHCLAVDSPRRLRFPIAIFRRNFRSGQRFHQENARR